MKQVLAVCWIFGVIACSSNSSPQGPHSCPGYDIELPKLGGAQYAATPSNCVLQGTDASSQFTPQLLSNNPNGGAALFVPGTCDITITLANQQRYKMTVQVMSVEPECNLPALSIHYFDSSGHEISENELISSASGSDGGR